ncbi:MFS transporter [Nocardioides sp. zg-1228]|uniref:MFS transporter n=1 Tax=Nocardioides sp. zg-1228 TaxID=2763008 RepID=UPI0016432B30|nr:MFS transporter [Nocardioides sp. zg-1228]MBC2933717.1 MFS transporter [Nocardioides sp. zg-1228]QSF59481.1 MFS transporter [Nocardioides sp. zg-1228]
MRWWQRVLPPTKLERDLVWQCVLSAFATGTFLAGTAVYFTQVVGLSGAQVGLGMSIAAGVTLVLQLPMGRLADRVGAKPLWAVASLVEAALYLAWPFIGDMATFVAMLSVLAIFETAGRNARNVYRIAVFPRAVRVRAMAYMRAARNVGYTLGAGASGVALGIGLDAVRLIPLVTGALLVLNALLIATVLPAVARAVPEVQDDGTPVAAPPAWRNPGFVVLSVCNGVLSSNQVLLNVVVPLWLVERTDAPVTLVAWLFGTNTVLAVALQVRASRVADSVDGSLRAARWSGYAFVLSCGLIAWTHETVGWVSIVLIWIGHVTITGAELWQSAADWCFTAELSDHRRLGDYQGIWGLGYQVEPIVFPALYTWLALTVGTVGWVAIAVIGMTAAVVAHPAARAAERHLVRIGAPVGV